MGFIYAVLIVFEALLSALLIAIIFMQKTKGGMGGSAFGGGMGEAIFGSRMGNVLTKATVVLGTVFLVNTILLTILTARRGDRGGSVMDQVDSIPMPQTQPMMPASLPEAGIPPAGPGEATGQGGFPMQVTPVEIPGAGTPIVIPAAEVPPVGEAPGQGGLPMQVTPVAMPEAAAPIVIPAAEAPPVPVPGADPAIQP